MIFGNTTLEIVRGDIISQDYIVKDADSVVVDITGYTAKFAIKSAIDGTSILAYDSTVDTSELSISGSLGQVSLVIPSATSAGFTFENAIYEVELINGSDHTTIIQGRIEMKKDLNV